MSLSHDFPITDVSICGLTGRGAYVLEPAPSAMTCIPTPHVPVQVSGGWAATSRHELWFAQQLDLQEALAAETAAAQKLEAIRLMLVKSHTADVQLEIAQKSMKHVETSIQHAALQMRMRADNVDNLETQKQQLDAEAASCTEKISKDAFKDCKAIEVEAEASIMRMETELDIVQQRLKWYMEHNSDQPASKMWADQLSQASLRMKQLTDMLGAARQRERHAVQKDLESAKSHAEQLRTAEISKGKYLKLLASSVKSNELHEQLVELSNQTHAALQHLHEALFIGYACTEEPLAASAAHVMSPADAKAALDVFCKQKQDILQRLRRRKCNKIPVVELERSNERVAALSSLKDKSAALHSVLEALEPSIESERQHVIAWNNQLRKVTSDASEGAVIEFRRVMHGALDGKSSSLSMEQLSGGQRTLVSLALLLAAAREGNNSSLLLLDEVDAALDEHNAVRNKVRFCCQSLALLRALQLRIIAHSSRNEEHVLCMLLQRVVAQLLVDLSRSKFMQMLCVTHNKAFQDQCDVSIHVLSTSANTEQARLSKRLCHARSSR
eukprot:351140-Chlamydomonas_euryale.AAC.45